MRRKEVLENVIRVFGEKDLVCDENTVVDVLKELYSLGYAVLNRGPIYADAIGLQVSRQ